MYVSMYVCMYVNNLYINMPGVWKQSANCQTFWPIFTTLVLLPYTLYTVQFQFTRHSLDLSDNVL